MAKEISTVSAYDRLYSLLRLACKTGNGYTPERQNALEKAIFHADKHSINLPQTILELRIDLDGLQHSFSAYTPYVSPPVESRVFAGFRRYHAPTDEFEGIYPIAGFQYYEGPRLRSVMRIGRKVTLQALTTNPYDPFAVAVFYGDLMIGYLPRNKNHKIWSYLRDGGLLTATISSIHSFDGYGAIEVQIQK